MVCVMDAIRIEYERIKETLSDINDKLRRYPKGYLRKRLIKDREYYYLQYREGEHVKSIYISPDRVESLKKEISERDELKKQAKELESNKKNYEKLLNIHSSYRPIRDVDYEDYTLFMSSVAHDYKKLDMNLFIEKYDVSKYRGIKKRYLAAYFDYIYGIETVNTRKTNDLVLDPYTYLMYFKYGDKGALEEELKKAIPAFLNKGLLITSVQEAVDGAQSK